MHYQSFNQNDMTNIGSSSLLCKRSSSDLAMGNSPIQVGISPNAFQMSEKSIIVF